MRRADDKDPQLRQRFQTSVTFYTKGAEGFITPARPAGAQPTSGTSTPRLTPSAAPSGSSTETSSSPQVTTAGSASAANPTPGATVRPPAPAPTAQPVVSAKAELPDFSQYQSSSDPEAQARPASNAAASNASAVAVKTEPDVPAPAPALALPPRQIEPESVRRKRKLQETLAEMAPGMEFELGVTDVSQRCGSVGCLLIDADLE